MFKTNLIVLVVMSLGVSAAVILTAMSDHNHAPPHWTERCLKSHLMLMPMMIGKTMTMQPYTVCDESETICVQGPAYRGPIQGCKQ